MSVDIRDRQPTSGPDNSYTPPIRLNPNSQITLALAPAPGTFTLDREMLSVDRAGN